MSNCNDNVASICGTNAGIIAELLMELTRHKLEATVKKSDKIWCRCSMKSMTVYCPFLTICQVEIAVNRLKRKGIVVSSVFNENPFDHTNWYAFTEYGFKLMKAGW